MASSSRIVMVIDDDLQRRRFGAELGPRARVREAAGGDELWSLAAAGAVDIIVAGVLHRNDEHLPAVLRKIGLSAPAIVLVGVFEPTRPSLDEAADLAREIPTIGFACRPGSRFEHLLHRRPPGGPPPTFTRALIDCIDRLPLYGAARGFARLQALHPSLAYSIPELARELGVSRRNLERWFQGPDICSARCFQSVCAAAEAAYLRLVRGLPEREIASVVEMLTREGAANPLGVSRAIRTTLRLGLEELRAGGTAALLEAVNVALRTSRDPTQVPGQWGSDTRFAAEPGVLAVPVEDRFILKDLARGVECKLDQFGLDAWPLLVRGAPLAKLTLELAYTRRESPHVVRARLISWLGELLVLRLIRREPVNAEAGEA
jgi:hypothetical protein